jgi:hypothetical protein
MTSEGEKFVRHAFPPAKQEVLHSFLAVRSENPQAGLGILDAEYDFDASTPCG